MDLGYFVARPGVDDIGGQANVLRRRVLLFTSARFCRLLWPRGQGASTYVGISWRKGHGNKCVYIEQVELLKIMRTRPKNVQKLSV